MDMCWEQVFCLPLKGFPFLGVKIISAIIEKELHCVLYNNCVLCSECSLLEGLLYNVEIWDYPQEPEDEVLLSSQYTCISAARQGKSKQPETKCPSKQITVFLYVKQ